jgi:hypothetical protein
MPFFVCFYYYLFDNGQEDIEIYIKHATNLGLKNKKPNSTLVVLSLRYR